MGRLQRLLCDERRLDLHQREGHPEDQSREAHPADGGLEEFSILLRGTAQDASVGGQQVEPRHVPAEGTGAVMVLAVYVAGDHTANGHEPGARRDRDEPAPGHEDLDDVGQKDAGLAGEQACRLVEGEHPPHREHLDGAVHVQGTVAVRATVAPGDHRFRPGDDAAKFARVTRAFHLARELGEAAPARQDHGETELIGFAAKTKRRSSWYLMA